jgi:rod shape-determining protein MreC
MWLRKYRTLWVSLFLLLMALAVISSHRREPGSLSPFERVIYGIGRPFQWALSTGLQQARGVWEGYIGLVNVQRDNRRLQMRIREMEQRITDYEEVRASNERLAALLDFQRTANIPVVAAQVIGEDPSGWFHSLIIDKGLAQGVHRGMPVVAPEGLVGHIIECADRTSKVLLIIDRNSSVAVMIQRSRTRGVMEGLGRGDACTLKYVARTETVLEGDRVITSGLGGIYPKGLLVGNVVSVSREGYGLFQRVEVAPLVDFDRLEEVLVVTREGATPPPASGR